MINDNYQGNEELKNYSITSRGYKIPLNSNQISFLKKELMVAPYCENPVRFPLFRISDKFLYIDFKIFAASFIDILDLSKLII